MAKQYIDVPKFTTLNEILSKNYSLSATQYKTFCIENKNQKFLSEFLDRELLRTDLWSEVWSETYIDKSDYYFLKTKALQEKSYLLDIDDESVLNITPKNFTDYHLKKWDIIISKDSNVWEIVILDRDYANTMLCWWLYRLPISKHKFYLLAFVKSDLFRQQIDYLVPRWSTIKHGKKIFLDCKIPIPNKNSEKTINYVEMLMKAIINKEIAIKNKHKKIMDLIEKELKGHQKDNKFSFSLPTINEILWLDRMDSSLYSSEFKEKEFLINNYINGFQTVRQMWFEISRWQNLQISNIWKSVYSDEYRKWYYKLILPKHLSRYWTVDAVEYIWNSHNLKTLNKWDIIFWAEWNEKWRSLVIINSEEKSITNIHWITIFQIEEKHDIKKWIFVKLFLDYYRSKWMIDDYAVWGNWWSLAIKYRDFLKFPNFPQDIEDEIVNLYYSNTEYLTLNLNENSFLDYDNSFNKMAWIYDLDYSKKHLEKILNNVIQNIADDLDVDFIF